MHDFFVHDFLRLKWNSTHFFTENGNWWTQIVNESCLINKGNDFHPFYSIFQHIAFQVARFQFFTRNILGMHKRYFSWFGTLIYSLITLRTMTVTYLQRKFWSILTVNTTVFNSQSVFMFSILLTNKRIVYRIVISIWRWSSFYAVWIIRKLSYLFVDVQLLYLKCFNNTYQAGCKS